MSTASSELLKQGYSIQKQILSANDLSPLQEQIISYYQVVTGQSRLLTWKDLPKYLCELAQSQPEKRRMLFEACQLAPEVSTIVIHPHIRELLAEVGVKFPVMKNLNVRMDMPGFTDRFLVDWHQDLLNLTAKKSVTIWIPLQDITEETGGVEVLQVPHFTEQTYPSITHERGYETIQIEKISQAEPVKAFMKMGDILMFNPFLVHRSMAGKKGAVRWTLIMRFDCLSTFYELTGEKPNFEIRNIEDPYLKLRGAQSLYKS